MIIPAITAALFLGRAFDITSMKDKNVYIYDTDSVTQNLETIPRTFTQSQYRLMSESSDVNDFLNIDGDLAIKAKKGQIDLQGVGNYLVKTVARDNTVEILITVYHETLTETFPSYAKLRSDWQSKSPSEVGTHYIRSITYGGQLIISYMLKATKSEYMQEIKAAVTANLAISGSLDVGVSGNIDKLSKEVGDKSSVEIRAFSTAGSVSPPQNMEEVLKMVDEYPSKIKEINKGKGSPLKVEIVSLSTLARNHSDYLKNFALDSMLNEATNKYDDVRSTNEIYKEWEKNSPIWSDEQLKLIDAFYRKLSKCEKEFRACITALKGDGGLNQFDSAFKAYGEGGDNIPNRFARELVKLQHTLNNTGYVWYPYTKAVSHYIHWGSVNCTLPTPEPVVIGLAAVSPNSFGNGGTLQCVPAVSPDVEEKKLTSGTILSQINGMRYTLPDDSTGPVLCAMCRLENATSAFTISGRTDCPAEMKLEYSGFLMTSKDAGTASTFVCMNKNPDKKIPKVEINLGDKLAATLAPVWQICPDCDEDENKKYVSCAVCSR